MSVKVDGKKADYTTDKDLGRITVAVSQGQSSVEVELNRTIVRLLAEILTVISLVVLLKINYSHERKINPLSLMLVHQRLICLRLVSVLLLGSLPLLLVL